MALTLIANLDPGLQCRNTLNAVIDLVGANHPWTSGSIPYTDSTNDYAQDNTNFFWDAAGKLLTSGNGLKIKGATSGTVTLNTKAVAGTWSLTLPDTAGTSGYVLSTNGSGVTSWIAGGGGGGMSIGGAITGGTAGRVLFAGAAGVLDDDSTFLWNDTTKDLAIGGKYYVNAAPALFVVTSSPENNWFEGNSGNAAVSGYGNFGTGDQSLLNVTSGYRNIGVGTNALKLLQSGANNTAMGSNALQRTVTDNNNIAIGFNAMETLGHAGAGAGLNNSNIAIGLGSLGNASQAQDNVAIGLSSLANVFGASIVAFQNCVIGPGAGGNLGVSGGANISGNTLIGPSAGGNLTGGTRNTWIGSYAGPSAVVSETVSISDGSPGGAGKYMFDCNLTTPHTWSFHYATNGEACGFHIYGLMNPNHSTATSFERVSLDYDADFYGTSTFWIHSQAGGSGVKRKIAIDGAAKAGAPAAGDLPSGSFSLIDDTSAGQTWLVFNKAGTIRKVQLT